MTTAIFLLAFFIFFVAVLNFLPTAGILNPVFATSVATVIGYMKAWNFLFPITELLWCVALVATYELVVWFVRVLAGTLKLIRGATH